MFHSFVIVESRVNLLNCMTVCYLCNDNELYFAYMFINSIECTDTLPVFPIV